jgi:hypothetical protein
MTWTRRNGGMVRGRWRTSYVCDTCGHVVSDDHLDWKATKRQHELTHATAAADETNERKAP